VHNATTNKVGLVNLIIGEGTVIEGDFAAISWGESKHFLKVELAPLRGNVYEHMGTMQLLSVPYALHAETVEQDAVDDDDSDPANEIQTLTLSGNQLMLSKNGGTINLPTNGGNGFTLPYSGSGTDANKLFSVVNDGTGSALYGENSTNGNLGRIGNSISGIYGLSNSEEGSGVVGVNTDKGNGVWGRNTITKNLGVLGNKLDGVYGISHVDGGSGVTGLHSGSGNGVFGRHDTSGNFGRIGTLGDGVFGKSFIEGGSGVAGIHDGSGNGVYGRSESGYAGRFDGHVYIKGKLGVGVQNPEKKLQVDGLIYSINGGFKFPDGTIQTTAATGGGSGTADNWGAQVVEHDNTMEGDGTVASPLSVNLPPRSKWESFTDLCSKEVTPAGEVVVNQSVIASTWTPIGPSFSFTKQHDDTFLEAYFDGNVFPNGFEQGASNLMFEIRINFQKGTYFTQGNIVKHSFYVGGKWDSHTEYLSFMAVFESLPKGTYPVQIYARAFETGLVKVFLDPGCLGSKILVKETW
jgi:hypothetical protein